MDSIQISKGGGLILKKDVARIIAVTMISTILVACGGTTAPIENGMNVENNGITIDYGGIPLDPFGRPIYDEQGRPVTAGFTETPSDFNGRNIHILTGNYYLFNYWADQDATPNETITIMRIMQQIAEDYNVTFTFEPAPHGATVRDTMIRNRTTGETPYDLINMGITATNKTPFIVNQLYVPLNHASVRDAIGFDTQPWDEASKLSTFGTNQYGVHFLMANSGDLLRSVFTFNRDFMEDFQLGNFYEMVFNREWTWEAFERICANIVQASNGSVTPIVMRREAEIVPGFMKANGGFAVEQISTGFQFVGYRNDAYLEALEFIIRLNQAGMLVTDQHAAWHRAAAGEFMFITGSYEPLRQLTRGQIETPFGWGMLPMPMGPRMDDFVSATTSADMWFIANGIQRPAEVATILVAMANRLSKLNIIETELNYGLQDEYSALVMEMLLDRIVIDYSGISGGNQHANGVRMALNGFQTPAQALQNVAPAVQQLLDEARFLASN